MSFKRSDRVAEAIKRELSEIITREVKDPRVHFATVMSVDLAEDLRFAKIYVSVMGTPEEKAETMEGLQNALGFLRSEIGHRIRLRFTPEIRFYLDETLDHALHIEGLLNTLKTPPPTPDNQGAETKKRAPRVRKKKETP